MLWLTRWMPQPKDFMDRSKMQSCTQKAGEVIYLPEGHYHATLGIGETLSLGVVAKSEKWQEIDNERRELARDANKYLAPKHVDKEGNIVDGFDVGPDHADIDSRIQKHLAAHGPNTQLSALQALMHVNAVGIKPMKADAKTVEDAFHVALGCDPLDVET
jgi:hypothetical protein